MNRTMTLREVKSFIDEYFDLDSGKDTRKHDYVFARYVGFYLSRNYTKKSLSQIGRVFGGRDHATVLNGLADIVAIKTNRNLKGNLIDADKARTIQECELMFLKRFEFKSEYRELEHKFEAFMEKIVKDDLITIARSFSSQIDNLMDVL